MKKLNISHLSLHQNTVLFFIVLFTTLIYFFATYFPYLYFLGALLLGWQLFSWLKPSEKNTRFIQLLNIFLIIALILADTDYTVIGVLAIGINWILSVFRTEDVSAALSKTQLMLLMALSIPEFLAQMFHWRIDFIYLFLAAAAAMGLLKLVNFQKRFKGL